jgi:chromate transporter
LQHPSFIETLKFWAKLGCISFGGPAGHLAMMHKYLVEEKKWISESRYLHALNYCMLLPGPEAQQMATYTGWLMHGIRGGLAAGILFILPSVFILLALSIVYVVAGSEPWVQAILDGLKPAVLAIIFAMLLKLAGRNLRQALPISVAVLAFVAIYFFHVPFPLVILSALIIGGLYAVQQKAKPDSATIPNPAEILKEKEYLINDLQPGRNIGSRRRMIILGTLFFLLWLFPLLILKGTENGSFWQQLIFFFTKSAFVTFGGAYAVLQYVAQVSVEQFQWLTSHQMVDGLALGESTPGPLIMVLAFVGFMAAYHQADFSLAAGTFGLLVTVFYTFLPCFLFIFAGAPIIEKTRNNGFVKSMLEIIRAAITGVLLSLAVYLFQKVLFSEGDGGVTFHYVHFGWFAVSLVALHYFKINIIGWLGVSLAYGGAYFFIQNLLAHVS